MYHLLFFQFCQIEHHPNEAAISQRLIVAFFTLLFPDDLDQDPLLTFAVELTVEDLFPGAEIEPALRDRDDNLPAHDRAFQVRVGVVLGGVVPVLAVGLLRGQLLQPGLEVLVEAGFVVIDEDARGDVHRIAQQEPFLDAAFVEALLDLGRDVEEFASMLRAEPEFLPVALHERPFLAPGS